MEPDTKPANNAKGGGILGAVIALVILAVLIIPHIHIHQTVTTCDQVLQSCTQQTYPMQDQP
jgi:hypothetical protein